MLVGTTMTTKRIVETRLWRKLLEVSTFPTWLSPT